MKLHDMNTIHIICIGTIITDRPHLSFLFGFTQVRFNFIDDVISSYEVG